MRIPVYALFTKVGPAGRVHRILRRPRPRRSASRSGASPCRTSAAAWPDARRRLHGRIQAPGRHARTAHVRAPAVGAEPGTARAGQRLSRPSSRPSARRQRVPWRGVRAARRASPRRCCAASISTSATQEGTPIDRLTGAMARAFGLDQRQAPRLRPGGGPHLLPDRAAARRDLPRGDAGLGQPRRAPAGDAAARRRVRGVPAARRSPAPRCCGASAQRAQADARRRAGWRWPATSRRRARLPLDPVQDADLPRLLPLLDRARALPFGYDAGRRADAGPLGLSQDAKLAAAARARLPARAGIRAVSAADLALGGADARQPDRPRLRIRGDPRLSDARRRRAARPRPGPAMDGARLGADLSRRREPARRVCAGISTRCSKTRCRTIGLDGQLVAAARATFSASAWRSASIRASSRPPPRPRAAAVAAQRRARRRRRDGVRPRLGPAADATGSPASSRRPGSATCCCPSLGAGAEGRGGRELGARRKDRSAAGQPGHARRRADVITLYTADYIAGLGRDAGRPRHRADAQPAASGAGPLHPGSRDTRRCAPCSPRSRSRPR